MDKNAGDVITAQRKIFSLNQLEKITGMNRSSILRYQRNQARIPESIAEKLANAFFSKKKDVDAFIALCQRSYNLTEEKIKAAKRRRSELARASREFRGDIRAEGEQPDTTIEIVGNKMSFPTHKAITTDDIRFVVTIVSRKTGAIVCSLAPKKGMTIYPNSESEIHGAVTPEKLLMFQSRKRPAIGRYALLDILKKTVEKSDVFSIGTKNPNRKFVLIDSSDLDQEVERLKLVRHEFDSADGADIADALDTTIAHLQFWKARIDNLGKMKKALLREIDSFSQQIGVLTSKK
jgi:transcriptional regulator with XRE-family HTH domain